MKNILNKKYDVIVVGSGFAGCHAAYPLVESGYSVAMIDLGNFNSPNKFDWSQLGFDGIRKNVREQSDLFLGANLDSLKISQMNKSHSGQMTHGAKSYITNMVLKLLPTKTINLNILQSLARGGLGNVWGGVCDFFDTQEILSCGLPIKEIVKNYQVIINRVGVSGVSNKFKLLKPINIDGNAKQIIFNSMKKASLLKKEKLKLSKSILAVLTKNKGNRKKTNYSDLDFWDLFNGSVYRPEFTFQELCLKKNFTYIPDNLVKKIKENGDMATVYSLDLNKVENKLSSKYIILAAGAVNSTRIMLRSFGLYNIPVPFLTKSHSLSVFWNYRNFNKVYESMRVSLCQLILKSKNAYSQIYSYKTLLLYRLLKSVPLPISEALTLLSIICPSVVVVDTRFPETMTDKKYMLLKRTGGKEDVLKISYQLSKKESSQNNIYFKKNLKGLSALGLLHLKTFSLPIGDTSHYAGGIPFDTETSENKLSVNKFGLINGTQRLFVADSASWRYLPSKPPGLTIMANANRIGSYVASLI